LTSNAKLGWINTVAEVFAHALFAFDRDFFIPISKERFASLLAFYRAQRANPNVAESHGISVILKSDWTFGRMFFVLGWAIERRIAFELKMVQDQNTIVNCGDVCGRFE
jgi:hypothetical protein